MSQISDFSSVCSTREAAERLGVSLRTIQLWVDAGVLQAWKTAGGHRRVSRESVEAFLRNGVDVAGETLTHAADETLFVAHQPVMDAADNIFGYVLRYQGKATDSEVRFADPIQATSRVIRTVFGELGFLGAIGDALCFLHIDEEMLDEELVYLLDPGRVVLELPANLPTNDDLFERCVALKRAGFRLLLDGYQLGKATERLVQIADFVRVNFGEGLTAASSAADFRAMSGRVKLIGGRLDSPAAYDLAYKLGCDYFQGDYFARPTLSKGQRIASSKAALLDLFRLLLASDIENKELERRLKLEPALCLSLLRLVNSASGGQSRRISSLREILLVLGRQNLIRWVLLLLYSEGHVAASQSPLLMAAAFRGRFLEYLVALLPGQALLRDKAFIVGLLSYVDALLGIPLPEVLGRLSLTPDVEEALLERKGMLGQLLELVIALDEQDQQKTGQLAAQLSIDSHCMLRGMVESVAWSGALARTA